MPIVIKTIRSYVGAKLDVMPIKYLGIGMIQSACRLICH